MSGRGNEVCGGPGCRRERCEPETLALGGRLARAVASAPIHLYRWTLKPYLGWHCRHLPTCSSYGLEAIALNGGWRGLWLTASRLARCQPFGTAGYDPVPDIRHERHPLAPWRYGRWTGRHIERPWRPERDAPG